MAENKFDITSTVLEKSVDAVKGFLEKLLGSSIEEAGLIFADNVRLRRFRNQLKIWEKAQKIIQEKGIEPKQISLKTLVPLIELSSLEEEETLQEKWSNLIVNYVDSKATHQSTVFPFILSQISTTEIFLLQTFKDKKAVSLELNESISKAELANLRRLGLIELIVFNGIIIEANEFKEQDVYRITQLGNDFLVCCSTE